MKLITRNAKLEDRDYILSGIKDTFRIEKAVINNAIISEQKKLIIKAIKNKEIRIVVKGNNPIGFLWSTIGDITPFGLKYGKWDKKYCWVNWVYVSRKHRGRGIGPLLYADLIKICKSKRLEEIMLDVFTVNSKAIRFHKKIGFKPFLSIYSKKIKNQRM
jgi:ribosomal protein S18 acetylase RimI-like enzyme